MLCYADCANLVEARANVLYGGYPYVKTLKEGMSILFPAKFTLKMLDIR
jgi:hypothetical protein